MLSAMVYQMPVLEGVAMGVNYGFNKVRFVSPVRAGARIRGVFHMKEVEVNPGFVTIVMDVTVEIEGQEKPALVAEWIGRRYLEETAPEPPLLGATPVEKALVADRVWRVETEGWQAMTEALRNTSPGMKDRALTGPDNYAQIPELGQRGKLRAQRFLDRLDGLLDGAPYLAGDRYSAADIMAMVVVDFAKWLKLSLPKDAAASQRWYASVSARPSAKV